MPKRLRLPENTTTQTSVEQCMLGAFSFRGYRGKAFFECEDGSGSILEALVCFLVNCDSQGVERACAS